MRSVTLLLAASMMSVAAFSTHAATIHNNESSAQVLRIVENGQEQQNSIAAKYIGYRPLRYQM